MTWLQVSGDTAIFLINIHFPSLFHINNTMILFEDGNVAAKSSIPSLPDMGLRCRSVQWDRDKCWEVLAPQTYGRTVQGEVFMPYAWSLSLPSSFCLYYKYLYMQKASWDHGKRSHISVPQIKDGDAKLREKSGPWVVSWSRCSIPGLTTPDLLLP